MKKEELRYDPVHEKISSIIEYFDDNKSFVIQIIIILLLLVGGWGYYTGISKEELNEAKALSGIAQNGYNQGEIDVSISKFEELLENNSNSEVGNQALVYLSKNSYNLDDDNYILSIFEKYTTGISDNVLDAGFYEMQGNSSLNLNKIDEAIEIFEKASHFASKENIQSPYMINLAIAQIVNQNFEKAADILKELLNDGNALDYSSKSKVEELLAVATFSMDK